MVGGLRRPRAVDDLSSICDAVERLLEMDLRLRPVLREQIQLQHQRRFDQQIDEAIARVYGSSGPTADGVLPPSFGTPN